MRIFFINVFRLQRNSFKLESNRRLCSLKTRLLNDQDEVVKMMSLWPDVVRNLTDINILYAQKYITKMLQYNVPNGKKTRALSLIYSYKMLASPEQITEDNIRLARILGWCMEMYQGFWLVEDDIMDRSTTRRGQSCWYLENNVGRLAINDGILLEQCVYHLLKIYFRNKSCYLNLLETFQQISMITAIGISMDMSINKPGQKPNLNLFTIDRYKAIIKYKTAYYTYVLPVTLALYFAGIMDREVHVQAKSILLEIGHIFQVQDDFLDCFGDSKITGKVGTDIQEGKCSWLAVMALQIANPEQRQIMQDCYGMGDIEKVIQVKNLYNDLELRKKYFSYEEEIYNLINNHIQTLPKDLPHNLFIDFLEKLYRRSV